MKPGTVNQNPEWTFLLPDQIADWDAITGWEEERLASMQQHLKPGMVLYDIGVEHGWLSAVYGSFTGHGNMVLVEPSPEMWVNIRKTWEANKFDQPIASFQMFCGEHSNVRFGPKSTQVTVWPDATADWETAPETEAMAYRYLTAPGAIGTVTIDQIAKVTKRVPDAITVDVEGFELEVMRGAEGTLRLYRPLVWLSVHPDLMAANAGHPDVQELFDFMTTCGYSREYLGTDHEQHHALFPLEWTPA